jgi:glutathione S-transferase
MLKLYTVPHTCALASHIALQEAGADFELVRLSFKTADQRKPEYLKVNPKGRVPALVTDRGVLTETPAILAYVAQTYPEARLAPLDDPFAFAECQAFNSYLCSTVHVAHAHGMRGYRWADSADAIAEMKRKVPDALTLAYEPIERELLKGPFVMGKDYGIADAYLFTIAQWMEDDGVDPGRFPRIIEHRARIAERPAVRRAVQAETG